MTGWRQRFGFGFRLPSIAWACGGGLVLAILGGLWHLQTDVDLAAPKTVFRTGSADAIPTTWDMALVMSFILLGGPFVVWLARSLFARPDAEDEFLLADGQRFEAELLAICSRDRERIAHELHDGVGAQLTAATLRLRMLSGDLEGLGFPKPAREAEAVLRSLQDVIDQTRRVARGLDPAELETQGLTEALEAFALQIRESCRLNCTFTSHVMQPAVNQNVGIQLFRIAQEAVNNAIKHSHADRMHIELATENGQLVLSVIDNGIGFLQGPDHVQGMGLRLMNHRAGLIGGELRVASEKNKGTTIRCSVFSAGRSDGSKDRLVVSDRRVQFQKPMLIQETLRNDNSLFD